MPKKVHPVDVRDRERISTAVSYNVHQRRGPAVKINEPAATLTEAATIAGRISGESAGKPCLVYAILPDGGATLVPPDMLPGVAKVGSADDDVRKQQKVRKEASTEKPPGAPEASAVALASAKEPKRALGKRASILDAAQRGVLPAAPDFTAETHKRYRAKLADLVALAEAGDVDGLNAVDINPSSSSPQAMKRYRDLCVMAMGVQ